MNRKLIFRDEWDSIVSQFIQTNEPCQGYWDKSEGYALGFADEWAKQTGGKRLLDLGCGRGRLLPRFADTFEEVVALDSDRVRIKEAENLARALGLNNVRFEGRFFEDCAGELGLFDMILCSHVIQHLPIGLVQTLISLIHAALKQGGLLVLLTSHATGRKDAYRVWRPGESGIGAVQETVDRDAFDCLMTGDYLSGAIPTHAFSLESLKAVLAGYELLKVHTFHALHKRNLADDILFRDKWINLPGLKGWFGIDVLALARK